MSGETYISIIGTMVADAELRYLPNGTGVSNFTVAVNARKFNKQTNEWEKRPAKFWRCQAWNQGKALLADNVANVLKKGDAVVVYGELETREYTTKDGEKRSADELRVEGIGKDLRWHQAYSNDVPVASARGGNWGGSQPASSADGWGNSQNSQTFTEGGWGNGPDSEPAF
jgi:single-strand DNA-binding protein